MAILVVALGPSDAAAQAARYEVSIASAAGHLLHLKAEFPTAGLDTLLVSLPAWSPGHYEIQNYARFVRGFTAADAAGRALVWDRLDKDTWRIPTGRGERVVIEFDFLADRIDLSGSRLVADFGAFLGSNVFLYQEGRLDRPAEVRFALPPGWRLATALRPADAASVYRAADYHELADAMTFVGRFSLDSLAVDGKWIRIAVYPAADYTPAVARNLRDGIARQAAVQNRLMGGPPYDVYTVFFNVYHEPIEFGGGLEHAVSQFDIMPAGGFADADGTLGDFMRPLMAHEFFHLWNVKRILDEVVRNLYTRFSRQGKGFRTRDLLSLLTEAGMPDVDGFYQRYINGRDPLPYERILTRAGIAVLQRTTSVPFLGVRTGGAANVLVGVVPGGAAAAAGVAPGDTLVSVGDIVVKADEDFGPAFRERYRGKAGQPLRIVVRRDGRTLLLDSQVRERTTASVRLSKAPNPDGRTARLWRGLATGTVGGS